MNVKGSPFAHWKVPSSEAYHGNGVDGDNEKDAIGPLEGVLICAYHDHDDG